MSPRNVSPEAVRRELLPGQSVELLRELHLVGRDGKLHADSLRKLKQVNHLLQLLAPALDDLAERHPQAVLVDAGAGNAYLGFILHELFLKPRGTGTLINIEPRAELVAQGQERAKRLGFDRLSFVQASLEQAAADPAALPERVHLVVALHACDTATDDALALAVRRGADHVAVVPCCQAEVAAQLKQIPERKAAPWSELWAHPMHRREVGAQMTNALRALTLEAFGYQVSVTELTGWEHSLKNELIRGRRVHRESRPARERLRALLAASGVAPKVVRLLAPELLPSAS